MTEDNIISYSDHHYGKGQVKVARVSKRTVGSSVIDDFKEYVVDIQLYGSELLGSFTEPTNKLVVPTDTIKNTVYIVASRKDSDGQSPAQNAVKFAIKISEHFVQKYSHITKSKIVVEEVVWPRLNMALSTRAESTHCFIDKQSYTHRCEVINDRLNNTIKVAAGIQGLQILKTHGSAFVDFWRDEYTTLRPASDRIMATKANLTWRFDPYYDPLSLDHDRIFDTAKQVFCEQFALHDSSQSVQHTIDISGRAILNSIPEMASIELNLPNVHYLLSNLEPFKLSNYNEIFLPTVEPFGNIYATLVKTEHAVKLFNEERSAEVGRQTAREIINSEKAVNFILNERPYESFDHLNKKVDELFLMLSQDDYRGLINNMTRLGDCKEKSHLKLIEEECRNLKLEEEDEIKVYNQLYEKRFQHTFVISATGKSKKEILESIKSRYNNDSEVEFNLCVEELKKIVRIRLVTVLNAYARKQHTVVAAPDTQGAVAVPNISSHVLDLTDGRPAFGVKAVLYYKEDSKSAEWTTIGQDVTNKDGRMTNLLNGHKLAVGEYKLVFLVEEYYRVKKRVDTFYPEVEIKFKINDAGQKYHVPLLLNQYGYSTYRGS